MLKFTLTIWISILFFFSAAAQSGCPGCAVSVPPGLPADTVYLPDLPDGVAGSAYNFDLSFRLPKSTTPVNAIDSTTPPGLTISKFEIVSISGLPPGMFWQPNKFSFDVGSETDGCIKFCGTPAVSDSFELTVTLKATVFFIAQEATFPMSLYIAPKVSTTDGFSMTPPDGCGSATVEFTNHVVSGGHSGFSYQWNFGDGSPVFTGENPAPHTYAQPGFYPVEYHATVDTAGYTLAGIEVLEVDCVDDLGLGKPDLYLQIYAPNNGPKVFDSSPDVTNTTLPYVFPVGLKLGAGNYTLRVVDEDSGLGGSDDECGTLSFNILSNGTLTAGGLKVKLNIVHPIDEIHSFDTVLVYNQPVNPSITAPQGTSICTGEGNLVLVSSYGIGNHWLMNGNTIAGANDFIYMPLQTGYYQAQIISQYGCVATSDSVFVEYIPLPAEPVWYNYRNSLRLYDSTALPDPYALQWYLGANPIPGETGFWYCSMTSGNYGLEVTDLSTGCTNFYSNLVVHDPNYDCTVGVESLSASGVSLFPNPANEWVTVLLPQSVSGAQFCLWDATGRRVLSRQSDPGQERLTVDVSMLPCGLYTATLLWGDGSFAGTQMTVQR